MMQCCRAVLRCMSFMDSQLYVGRVFLMLYDGVLFLTFDTGFILIILAKRVLLCPFETSPILGSFKGLYVSYLYKNLTVDRAHCIVIDTERWSFTFWFQWNRFRPQICLNSIKYIFGSHISCSFNSLLKLKINSQKFFLKSCWFNKIF